MKPFLCRMQEHHGQHENEEQEHDRAENRMTATALDDAS